jgi:CheY-like chemotaxis protein
VSTNKKFLLIDDDPDDQEFFLEATKEVDDSIECSFASSCEEALETLKSNAYIPDYIFLDLNMPKVDGKKCLAEIKKIFHVQHIPVIIYSTSSLKKDIEETASLGAVYFLTKPSAFRELCSAIEKVLSLNLATKITE